MRPNLPTNSTIDGRVKVTGILAITCNAFLVFGILAFEFQSGGHGEMANFYTDSMVWTFPSLAGASLPGSDCCEPGAGPVSPR
jgi:hypothetical protein